MVIQLCLIGYPKSSGYSPIWRSKSPCKEIEFDAASNPYIATSTTAECLALIFMIVVGDPSTVRQSNSALPIGLMKSPTMEPSVSQRCHLWLGSIPGGSYQSSHTTEACVICYLECCKLLGHGMKMVSVRTQSLYKIVFRLWFVTSKLCHILQGQVFVLGTLVYHGLPL